MRDVIITNTLCYDLTRMLDTRARKLITKLYDQFNGMKLVEAVYRDYVSQEVHLAVECLTDSPLSWIKRARGVQISIDGYTITIDCPAKITLPAHDGYSVRSKLFKLFPTAPEYAAASALMARIKDIEESDTQIVNTLIKWIQQFHTLTPLLEAWPTAANYIDDRRMLKQQQYKPKFRRNKNKIYSPMPDNVVAFLAKLHLQQE